jgi:hypothetical protein
VVLNKTKQANNAYLLLLGELYHKQEPGSLNSLDKSETGCYSPPPTDNRTYFHRFGVKLNHVKLTHVERNLRTNGIPTCSFHQSGLAIELERQHKVSGSLSQVAVMGPTMPGRLACDYLLLRLVSLFQFCGIPMR